MLNHLHLYNFQAGKNLPYDIGEFGFFSLKTCQRTLVLSLKTDPLEDLSICDKYQSHRGENAYRFLLETICGLQSKLLGENEIVSQFKDAFKEYLSSPSRNNEMIRVLEKLLKDSKEIRSRYLIGISQKTYASITRKIMMSNNAHEVLIMGSGNLAEDLINQFKKKCPVKITARNQQRVKELAEAHQIEIVPWEDFEAYKKHSHIANTIGANVTLLDEDFFSEWVKFESRAFIDLGSPSVIDTQLGDHYNVFRLEDIFAEGAIHEKQKVHKIKQASEAIETIVDKRSKLFSKKPQVQYLKETQFV
jgi:glutamyl-tRNA reductase